MKYKNPPDVYEGNEFARFALGKMGNRPLIVFGINPSFADKNQSDRTINRVIRLSELHGFDGWIMLNIYPLRNKDPKQLPTECDEKLHEKNIRSISAQLLKNPDANLCAAWGTNIESRKYLSKCLLDIFALENLDRFQWKSIGPLSQNQHPQHPLYLLSSLPLLDFNIEKYSI